MSFWDGSHWVPDGPIIAPRPRSRVGDWIATSVVVIALLALWVPMVGTSAAGGPAMSITPGAGAPGLNVTVTGSAFPRRAAIQLTWDGDATIMPTVTASGKGDFHIRFAVPATAVGQHTVAAMTVVQASKASGNGVAGTASASQLAAVSFTVSGPVTPAPTQAPTPTAAPTPPPTPAPTLAPTAMPAPTATPAPSPSSNPDPTPTLTPPIGVAAISGTVYRDNDRDGVHAAGEPPMAAQLIELRSATGTLISARPTNTSGGYSFPGLTAGTYNVQFGDDAWRAIRRDLVPTTTGTLKPQFTLQVEGPTILDFGWRPIIRSNQIDAPVATYTGPSGLRVETYNDAVPPEAIYTEMMQGMVGPEARFVVIRFDFGTVSSTAAGWQGSPGSFSNYSAASYGTYEFWLDGGDQILSHEYGHAWSYYYDVIVQQDSTFSTYLAARGLAGDPRVGTSYRWMPAEMIAEDYRQLFGSANARSAWQTNQDIPTPDQVPGLREFFLTTYQSSAGG